MRRNPHLSIRQPEATSMARVQGFCEANVNGFFYLLEELVDKHGFDGTTIYNVDESGFSTVQKKLDKVVALKGKSQVGGVTSGERGVNTTIVCCCNPSGHFIPPMIIFKRQRMCQELAVDAPMGSIVEVSESGYINTELFTTWLKHFQKHVNATKEKPVLLLLDGHTTHSKNLAALTFAKENYITLLQLPGHTTHRLQPLDRSFFKPLGSYYVKEQTKWLRSHPGMKITQYQISGLLSRAYGDAATPNTAAGGFEASGVWPLNRNKFTIADFAPAENLKTPIPEELPLATTTEASPMTFQSAVLTDSAILTPSTSNIAIPSTSNAKKLTTLVASNPDTLNDETASSQFQKALKKISPVPKATSRPPVNTSKRGRPPGTAQAALELTSSPYKNELMEKSAKNSRKNHVQNKRKSKTTTGKNLNLILINLIRNKQLLIQF